MKMINKHFFRLNFALGTLCACMIPNAQAGLCATSSDPLVISANCDTLLLDSSKSVVIVQSGIKITESNFGIFPAVSVSSTIGTFTNNGTIQTALLLASANEVTAFKTYASGSIAVLNNAGTITASAPGKMAMDISGSIGTFNNSGTISGTFGADALYLSGGSVTLLNNTGTISAIRQALNLSSGSRIETLNNSGLISSGPSGSNVWKDGILIQTGASIGSLVNSGTIDHSSTFTYPGQNITTYFAAVNNQGSIDRITNTGNLTNGNSGNTGFGIINTGTINTVNNLQNNLTLLGNLPKNYNVVINSSTQYGKLAVTSTNGVTNFGIYQGAVIPNGSVTYASVLSGLTAANLTSTTGTYGGGLVSLNWTLLNRTGTTWDLTTSTVVNTVKPVVPNSAAATSLATQVVNSYEGAITNPSSNANPTLENGTTLVGAVQSLTTSQVNELTSVHAEGYSSNMTINLEQMKTVANTVMDRIHNGISESSGNSVSYKLDAGRYAWADVAAFNGTVNSYDGLAGFGYQSYYGVVGVDLFRNQTGGLGIYAGAGQSNMNQSTQVSQSFRNNMGYVGMYGGVYLGRDWKLSGALGYSLGQSKATRNNPDVGEFTGGVASDNYSSRGAFAAVKLSHSMLIGKSFTLTPFLGGSYSQLNTSAVNESGGGDFNYSINAAKSYQAISFLGAEFVQPLNVSNSALSAVGFYRFSYNWSANNDAAHTVTATSSVFGSFNQTGANMGPVSNLFGLGLQGQLTKDVSLRVGAVASINSNGYQYGGGGELKVRF
jgi:hypothetical protein